MNLTKAAKKLYLTQSTLSRQMSRLEASLGVSLFTRSQNILHLTPAGELLKARAAELIQHAENLKADLRKLDRSGMQGFLRIASFSMTASMFNRYLAAFRESHRDVEVDIIPAEPVESLRLILNQQYDIAFTTVLALAELTSDERGVIEHKTVDKGRACAFVRSGHRLSGRSSLTLSDLKDEVLVSVNDSSAYKNMQLYFHSIGFKPQRLIIGEDLRVIRFEVNYRNSVAILFDLAALDIVDNCVQIPIIGCTGMDAGICFAWLKPGNEYIHNFLNA